MICRWLLAKCRCYWQIGVLYIHMCRLRHVLQETNLLVTDRIMTTVPATRTGHETLASNPPIPD